jgi:hypothetical protein
MTEIPANIIAAADYLTSDVERLESLITAMDKDLKICEDKGKMLPRSVEVGNITIKLLKGVPDVHLAYMLAESVIREVERRRTVPWPQPQPSAEGEG